MTESLDYRSSLCSGSFPPGNVCEKPVCASVCGVTLLSLSSFVVTASPSCDYLPLHSPGLCASVVPGVT